MSQDKMNHSILLLYSVNCLSWY